MSKPSNVLPLDQATRYTERDLHLASLIYPILINLAKTCKVMTYSEMISAVNEEHPIDAYAPTMRPIQCGRLLGVIYDFAESHGLPRISTLIINKREGDCGEGIAQGHDCDAERATCYAHDWSAALPEFWAFIKAAKDAIIATKPVKKPISVKKPTATEARQIRWEYFIANRDSCIPEISDFNDVILEALMAGVPVEQAFAPYVLLTESV